MAALQMERPVAVQSGQKLLTTPDIIRVDRSGSGLGARSQTVPTQRSTHLLLLRGQGACLALPFVVLLLPLLCQWAAGAEAEMATWLDTIIVKLQAVCN